MERFHIATNRRKDPGPGCAAGPRLCCRAPVVLQGPGCAAGPRLYRSTTLESWQVAGVWTSEQLSRSFLPWNLRTGRSGHVVFRSCNYLVFLSDWVINPHLHEFYRVVIKPVHDGRAWSGSSLCRRLSVGWTVCFLMNQLSSQPKTAEHLQRC